MRVTVVLVLLAAAACSGGEAGTEPSPEERRDPLVEAMWAAEGDEVEVQPLEQLFLPSADLPDAVELVDVAVPGEDEHHDRPPDPWGEATWGVQTLYADPDAPDPAQGRALVVGRTTATDSGAGIAPPGGDAVDLHGVEGRILRAGDLWVAAWPLPLTDECITCEQEGFVAGREVDRDRVLAAARRAAVHGARPSLPPAVRPGLQPLGTVGGSGLDVPGWASPFQGLRFRDGDAEVHLSVHRADPRLVAHIDVWASDGRSVLLDGNIWRAGSLGGDAVVKVETHLAATPEVEASVDAILASLRPVDGDAVADERARLLASVPLRPCDLEMAGDPHPSEAHLHGTAGDARWVVGVSFADGALVTCDTVARVGTVPLSGGGGGPTEIDRDPIAVVSRGTVGQGDGRSYQVTIGHVAEGVAGVAATVDGLAPVDAALASTGPDTGRRWFAVVVDLTPIGLQAADTTLVAHAPDGTEVARADG